MLVLYKNKVLGRAPRTLFFVKYSRQCFNIYVEGAKSTFKSKAIIQRFMYPTIKANKNINVFCTDIYVADKYKGTGAKLVVTHKL